VPKELVLCHVTYNAPVTDHLRHCLDHLFFSFSRVAVWGLRYIVQVDQPFHSSGSADRLPLASDSGNKPYSTAIFFLFYYCNVLRRIILGLQYEQTQFNLFPSRQSPLGMVGALRFGVVTHYLFSRIFSLHGQRS
jgi:hypothetical protein